MNKLFDPSIKAIQEEAEKSARRLLNGDFDTLVAAKMLVERRKGLLAAIDILQKQAELDEENEDD